MYPFDNMILCLLDLDPVVGLLDHKTVLFLVFKGICIVFSIVAVLIHIPTSNKKGSPLETSLTVFITFDLSE